MPSDPAWDRHLPADCTSQHQFVELAKSQGRRLSPAVVLRDHQAAKTVCFGKAVSDLLSQREVVGIVEGALPCSARNCYRHFSSPVAFASQRCTCDHRTGRIMNDFELIAINFRIVWNISDPVPREARLNTPCPLTVGLNTRKYIKSSLWLRYGGRSPLKFCKS